MGKVRNKVLKDVHDEVKKGLEYMTQEEADGLVGDYGSDGVLIHALVAHNRLLAASLLQAGAEMTPEFLNIMADQQTVMLTLAHYLYAAGVRRCSCKEAQ